MRHLKDVAAVDRINDDNCGGDVGYCAISDFFQRVVGDDHGAQGQSHRGKGLQHCVERGTVFDSLDEIVLMLLARESAVALCLKDRIRLSCNVKIIDDEEKLCNKENGEIYCKDLEVDARNHDATEDGA